jgi:hypothetical protein
MRETSGAMPDPRLTTSYPAVSAHDDDAQCRGIGPSGSLDSPHSRGRGLGASPNTAADVPVARPVVREADGHAVRAAITKAVVARDAAERAAVESWPVAPRDAAPSMQASTPASADLIGLLDHLRLAVARYACDRRAAGAPIERVLPEVKGLVRDAAAYDGWYDPAEALMQQVVGWTITAYYDKPEPPREGVHVQ